ncbi:MAG: Ig-like domain-containing protein [Gemmatimonadota bacterium]|nr:Ig-like domain-containing protein [Gemmatimonadota bacterium]
MMRIRFTDVGSVLAAALLAACSGSTEPVPRAPSLKFVAGANVTDTIQSILPQALLVEVHDSTGAIAPPGTVVRFESLIDQSRPSWAYVEPLTSTFFGTFASAPTGQDGRAAVIVQLGYRAGPVRIVVSVPILGLVDTAHFTVTPGAAAQVHITPIDTTLATGKSYTLTGGVTDRFGNTRSDPVTWSASGPGITVSSAGVVTTVAAGRHTITASASALGTGTASVSVVPQGRTVVWGSPYSTGSIYTIDLDGTNRTDVATVNDGGIGSNPAWIPGTNTIVHSHYVNALQTLHKVDAGGGAASPFFAAQPPNVSHEAEPVPSADGQWLYFSAYDTRCNSSAYCLYRSRIDGSAPELLGSFISSTDPSWRPAPSPDGSKVAFMLGGPYGTGTIKVFDVATKTTSSWGLPGEAPVWSPDGAQIAYVSNTGGINLITPDGSITRTLAPGYGFGRPLGWSPDGKWIVGQSGGMLQLIDVAGGAVLPLRWSGGLNSGRIK